jgi:Pectate lyase superfamily protein
VAYTPANVFVYAAAQAGAMAGMGLPGSAAITETNSAEYLALSEMAGVFAQEFDTQWAAQSLSGPDIYEQGAIQNACTAFWIGHAPSPQIGQFLVAGTYLNECLAIIALVVEGANFNTSQGTVLPDPGSGGGGGGTTPIFVINLANTVATMARDTVFVDGYSAQNDGGQGYFQWDATSTAVANGGTIIQVTGIITGRWMRVFDANIWVTWFGAKGDGVTDDSTAIQATINAAGAGTGYASPFGGGVVFFPILNGQITTYLIKTPLVLDYTQGHNGITLLGEGVNINTASGLQSTIKADFPIYSGTAASIGTVTGTYFVPLTGLVGLTANTAIGDCITVSNTGSTDSSGNLVNNSSSSITAVNAGGETVSYMGFNPHVNYQNGFPISNDANNGAIHWVINKNLISLSAFYIQFRNLCFDGSAGAGYLVYSTSNHDALANTTSPTFTDCNFFEGHFGITGGDIPLDWVGSTLNATYPVANNDFFKFHHCTFNGQINAAAKLNLGGQQKSWTFHDCSFSGEPIGVWNWAGSFNAYDTSTSQVTETVFQLYDPSDTTGILGVNAEESPRLLVTANGVHSNAGTTPYNCILENIRLDFPTNEVPSDGFIVHWTFMGGLDLKNLQCNFGVSGFSDVAIGCSGYMNGEGYTPLTGFFTPVTNSTSVATTINQTAFIIPGQFITFIGLGSGIYQVSAVGATTVTLATPYVGTGSGLATQAYSGPQNTIGNSPAMRVANCFLPNSTGLIVAQPVGFGQPSYWYSQGNGCAQAGVLVNAPNGYIPLQTSNLEVTSTPFSLMNITTPTITSSTSNTTADGFNLFNNGMSSVELTAGSTQNLYGMTLVYPDQVRTLCNLTGSPINIEHESGTNPIPYQRFHSPTLANVAFSVSAVVRYSSSLSRWLVISYQ